MTTHLSPRLVWHDRAWDGRAAPSPDGKWIAWSSAREGKEAVYVMTAEPEGARRDEDYGQLATQWFIVSDLGLTAFSGNDGINVFLNSLATTEAKSGIEIRLIARNNEVLAVRTTDAAGFAKFEAGLSRGEGGLAPASRRRTMRRVITQSHVESVLRPSNRRSAA